MALQLETGKLSPGEIIDGQRRSFEEMKAIHFIPTCIARDQYFLPQFRLENSALHFFRESVSVEGAIEKIIKRLGKCRVLDLGCGAGFWLTRQQEQYGRELFEGWGISATDYRRPEQRGEESLILDRELEINGKKIPVYRTPGDPIYRFVGQPRLVEEAKIDDGHYRVGDVHDVLRQIPAGTFDIVVSYQAFRYLLDPLRVLKGVWRILERGGFAFLEGFSPMVYKQDSLLSSAQLQELFRTNGYPIFVGQYEANQGNNYEGLSLKRDRRPHLSLPEISYRKIISGRDGCPKMTYQVRI